MAVRCDCSCSHDKRFYFVFDLTNFKLLFLKSNEHKKSQWFLMNPTELHSPAELLLHLSKKANFLTDSRGI